MVDSVDPLLPCFLLHSLPRVTAADSIIRHEKPQITQYSVTTTLYKNVLASYDSSMNSFRAIIVLTYASPATSEDSIPS